MWKEYTKLNVLQKLERTAILDKNNKKKQQASISGNTSGVGIQQKDEDEVNEINISIE